TTTPGACCATQWRAPRRALPSRRCSRPHENLPEETQHGQGRLPHLLEKHERSRGYICIVPRRDGDDRLHLAWARLPRRGADLLPPAARKGVSARGGLAR